jgi:hypothetical protein
MPSRFPPFDYKPCAPPCSAPLPGAPSAPTQLLERLPDVEQLLQLAELSQLGEKLDPVGRIQRVLILDLRHEQLQKIVLAHQRIAGGFGWFSPPPATPELSSSPLPSDRLPFR